MSEHPPELSQRKGPPNWLRAMAFIGFVLMWSAVIYFSARNSHAWIGVVCVAAALGLSFLLYGLIVHRVMNFLVPVLPVLALALVYFQTKAFAVAVIALFLGLYMLVS